MLQCAEILPNKLSIYLEDTETSRLDLCYTWESKYIQSYIHRQSNLRSDIFMVMTIHIVALKSVILYCWQISIRKNIFILSSDALLCRSIGKHLWYIDKTLFLNLQYALWRQHVSSKHQKYFQILHGDRTKNKTNKNDERRLNPYRHRKKIM